MMQFRRFHNAGIEAFREYLHRLRSEPTLDPPWSLLSDDTMSEPLDPPISAEPEPFENRMAFARWLHDAVKTADVSIPYADAGFWSWLSLALFDQVCPADGKRKRKPYADARHIPDYGNWGRRYRHLLESPYEVYQVHRDNPERAIVALINPLHKPGELTEHLTGRRELIRCPGTIALASYLFIDRSTWTRRRDASGKSANRLGKLMNQYRLTWDLPEMDPVQFANILPSEFDKFRKTAASQEDGAAP